MDDSSGTIQMHDIVRQSTHMKSALNELKEWENEIKKEEKVIQESEPDQDQVVPKKIRSHIFKELDENNLEKSRNDSRETQEPEMHSNRTNDLENSNKWKETGNKYVKQEEYGKAVDAYTRAIAYYDGDPNFYANRALCYLRLEKYDKSIEDCRRAIDLDPSKIKAFYRMMQAYEALCEIEIAIEYCRKVLALDSSNKEAQKSLQRLEAKICANKVNCSVGVKVKSDAVWSRMESKSYERIRPVVKSLHLRSQLPLKRIKIFETPGLKHECDEAKYAKNIANYAATTKEKIQVLKASEDVDIENAKQANKIRKFTVPSSSSQFYSTWKELASDEEKFDYLNFIEAKNLNRLLGACFDYETLSEFIILLDKFCTPHKRKALDLLMELSKHDQIRILSMFLSTQDLQALRRLLFKLGEEGMDKDTFEDNFCLKDKI